MQQHIDRIRKKLDELMVQAEKLYGYTKYPNVKLARMGTMGGTAHSLKNEIRLNQGILEKNIPADVDHLIDQTLPHELAHLITDWKFGRHTPPHGKEWQSVMRSFGLNPDRTHSMDVLDLKIQKKKYEYKCGCAEPHMVGGRIHNAILDGSRTYTCRRCGERLQSAELQQRRLSTHLPNENMRKTMSKAALCRWLYENNPGRTSKEMQMLFMQFADCTKAGAATYYYQIHK